MKNNHLNLILLLITAIFLLYSCNTEEPTQQYTTAIRNTSNKPLNILILGDSIGRNTPVYDTLVNTTLNSNEIAFKKSYRSSGFNGMKVIMYYVKVTFLDNNKGYICEKDSLNNLCFKNKVALTEIYYEKDFTHENGVYYYDITQEDYENAHELQ